MSHWFEFSVEGEPVASPVRCVVEAQVGRPALLLTRELQLRRACAALADAEAKLSEVKTEVTAATPPTENAAVWIKQRAEKRAELKKATKRHAALDDELSQIQKEVEAEAEWLAATRSQLQQRRMEAATAALWHAAQTGNVMQVARTLQKGARIDAMNKRFGWKLDAHGEVPTLRTKGINALLLSCGDGHTACARQLLAAGADPNAANHDGFTALHIASCRADTECMELLLAAGASQQSRAGANWKSGWTPMTLAQGCASVSLLEAALPEATVVPPGSCPNECAVCGKTEADMAEAGAEIEWMCMPCSDTSISQVAASAEDDAAARLRLQQHIMCGICARDAVQCNRLYCGICKDPCIPSPAAWAQLHATVATNLETARALAAAAWAAVSQAAAARHPSDDGETDHVEAAKAAIEAADAINGYLAAGDKWMRHSEVPSSMAESVDQARQELKHAMEAAAVIAGRYIRRLLSIKDGALYDAIDAAIEADSCPEVIALASPSPLASRSFSPLALAS